MAWKPGSLGKPWQKVPGEGWSVTRDLQRWRFR
jgi:hypothetical protein